VAEMAYCSWTRRERNEVMLWQSFPRFTAQIEFSKISQSIRHRPLRLLVHKSEKNAEHVRLK
jgi:hypothetical protein